MTCRASHGLGKKQKHKEHISNRRDNTQTTQPFTIRQEQNKRAGDGRSITLANVDDHGAVISGVDQTTSGRAKKDIVNRLLESAHD